MLSWDGTSPLNSTEWVCGYCGREVAGDVGYKRSAGYVQDKIIYICPHCQNPTAFVRGDEVEINQYPGAAAGNDVAGLPPDVQALYDEARRCIQYTSYTSAVLTLRKLLMHVAVEQGAEPNKSFATYVGYLDENHWIPPNGREWVDKLRSYGNEATHEIKVMSEEEAVQLLDFAEMLLKFVYEFPSKLS